MKSFVEWLTARRYRMVLLAAATLLPPMGLFLAVIAQAIVVLAVLLWGVSAGLAIAGSAIALMAIPALFVGGNPQVMLIIGLANLLPAIGLGVVLERSRSISLTTQVATVVAVSGVVLFFLAGSPTEVWQGFFDKNLAAMGDRVQELPAGFVSELSRIMTGVFGAVTLLTSMIAVFIGRWWQSILSKPGAFGREFRQLRMGFVVGLIASVIFVAAALTKITLLENVTLVLVSGFLLHGLAVIHVIAGAGAAAGSFWLVAAYGLMIIAMPFAELAVAGLGFLDNWFDLKSRVVRADSQK